LRKSLGAGTLPAGAAGEVPREDVTAPARPRQQEDASVVPPAATEEAAPARPRQQEEVSRVPPAAAEEAIDEAEST